MPVFPDQPALIGEVLALARAQLEAADVDSPWLSAQLIVGHVLGMDLVSLFAHKEKDVTAEQAAAVRTLTTRRAKGEPVAYLLGEKEFFGLSFRVTPDVLIPRPETEHIVELTLARFSRAAAMRFVDCGTGSGALAVTLAALYEHSRGLAVDTNAAALEVARFNARRRGVAERLVFACADFAVLPCPDASLDLVVANPPYISEADYGRLTREVRDFEPKAALTPNFVAAGVRDGATGLEACAAVVATAGRSLKPGGVLLMEFGCAQAAQVREMWSGPGQFVSLWSTLEIHPDLAGLDRVAVFEKSSAGYD